MAHIYSPVDDSRIPRNNRVKRFGLFGSKSNVDNEVRYYLYFERKQKHLDERMGGRLSAKWIFLGKVVSKIWGWWGNWRYDLTHSRM